MQMTPTERRIEMTTNTTHRPTLKLLASASVTLALMIAGTAQAAERPAKPTEAPSLQEGKRVAAKSLPTPKSKTSPRATTSNYAPGFTRPFAECNYHRNTMKVGSLFKFNLGRFPNGSYVYTQYAFLREDSGNYIGQWRMGNWLNEGFVRPAISTEHGAPGQGYITVYDWNHLVTRSVNFTWGHWVVANRAAIWNGSSWELTAWSGATHSSYNRFGSGDVASSCWVSN